MNNKTNPRRQLIRAADRLPPGWVQEKLIPAILAGIPDPGGNRIPATSLDWYLIDRAFRESEDLVPFVKGGEFHRALNSLRGECTPGVPMRPANTIPDAIKLWLLWRQSAHFREWVKEGGRTLEPERVTEAVALLGWKDSKLPNNLKIEALVRLAAIKAIREIDAALAAIILESPEEVKNIIGKD